MFYIFVSTNSVNYFNKLTIYALTVFAKTLMSTESEW